MDRFKVIVRKYFDSYHDGDDFGGIFNTIEEAREKSKELYPVYSDRFNPRKRYKCSFEIFICTIDENDECIERVR